MRALDRSEDSEHSNPTRWIVLWLVVVVVTVTTMMLLERQALLSELTTESEELHALASQRANQHDAHLTSLSALALAGEGRRTDLFLEVAATIMRFYPRIKGIYLVSLEGSEAPVAVGADIDLQQAAIINAAQGSTGKPTVLPVEGLVQGYLIVKRSPNNDAARYGLALLIDGQALLATDSDYWSSPGISRHLILPGAHRQARSDTVMPEPQYSQLLSSATQPLRLATATEASIATYLHPARILIVVGMITGLFVFAMTSWKQRLRTKQAEKRADLSDLETRLSHASRVNALGEMASGMAHELTQPLTAILAEAQAARRLIGRGAVDDAQPVLDDIVSQTHRASGILERLRTWTRPRALRTERFDLRESAQNVRALFSNTVIPEGTTLEFNLPETAVLVQADKVEMEQVLFNLVKNALEATEEQNAPQSIRVALKAEGAEGTITVTDTGPGIEQNIRDRLFTPFVTTREGGTGLGLALSQRLVERAGGEIKLVDLEKGTCFRVALPLAVDQSEAAE